VSDRPADNAGLLGRSGGDTGLGNGTGAGFVLRGAANEVSGAKGIRTPDLLIANQPLYQLSYGPVMLCCCCVVIGDCKGKRLRSSSQETGGVAPERLNRAMPAATEAFSEFTRPCCWIETT
jgi:hypothetical protein